MMLDGMDLVDFDDEYMGLIVVCEIRVFCIDEILNRYMYDLFYIFFSCVVCEFCLIEFLKYRECCCFVNVLVKYIDFCIFVLILLLFGCLYFFVFFFYYVCFVFLFF